MADFSKATLPAKINATDRGSYLEPQFVLDGMDAAANLNELLQFILDMLGAGGVGEANTASNLGGGQGLFASKLGSDLRFKSLVAGTNVTLSADGNTITINATGGSEGLEQYEAMPLSSSDEGGCYITCTALGATYSRIGGAGTNTEGVLTIPEGSLLRGVAVHFMQAQAPGNTFFLNIDRPYSGPIMPPWLGINDAMPPLATVSLRPSVPSDVAPATSYVHSGTPLIYGISEVDDDGSRIRIRLKITNYNQQVGANASILSVIFP